MARRDGERNLYLEILTQECIFMMLAYHADVIVAIVMLWDEKRYSECRVLCKPKARIEFQNSCMELCHQCLKLEKEELLINF